VTLLSFEKERLSAVHSGKPGSLFLIIPDIFNRESIWVSFRMDPRYQPAGMTTGVFSV
jgi:hypothetical protein